MLIPRNLRLPNKTLKLVVNPTKIIYNEINVEEVIFHEIVRENC